ncbi:SRP54, partial [Symbiodinium microadriaticum]
RTLVEEMKDAVDVDRQQEMGDRLNKGIFTLRDMYEQFQSVMKLGPLNKVMGMIPGLPPWMAQGAGGADGDNRIKVFMYMMDSMTDDELDGKVEISPSRVNRIARGSGQHPEHVQVLLKCHKQFGGVIKKMGKSGLMKGGDEMMAKKMQRNPQGVMQQLQKAMDPRMLAQMGGAGNLMNMMKEMSGMDQGDMKKMMSAMGGMGM